MQMIIYIYLNNIFWYINTYLHSYIFVPQTIFYFSEEQPHMI